MTVCTIKNSYAIVSALDDLQAAIPIQINKADSIAPDLNVFLYTGGFSSVIQHNDVAVGLLVTDNDLFGSPLIFQINHR